MRSIRLMIYFIKIEPTEHYLEFHSEQVPWYEVVKAILSVKNPRKKGNKLEIENDEFYILMELREKTLFVIDAKRMR